ncbi:hypothetical protein MRB53_041196 [Persea americana]|nr:hypothetical protein MRB53_041196 [Persea americana]
MAAPADIRGQYLVHSSTTLTPLPGYSTSAKWIMNTTLSDPHDDVLAVQGVGYLKRKAIGMATVTVVNSCSKDAEGHHIVHSASSASGIPGASEKLVINGKPHASDHSVYGSIITTPSLKKPSEIEDPFLTENLLPDSFDDEGKALFVASESDKSKNKNGPWTAEVTSGYMTIDGTKRWVRLNHFKCPAKGMDKKIRLVYDFVQYE